MKDGVSSGLDSDLKFPGGESVAVLNNLIRQELLRDAEELDIINNVLEMKHN